MEKRAKRKYDLTEGGILSKLLLVALPIMGTQLMQMSYNLTDMFWLGRLSSDAVAASGTAGMFMWLSMAFVMIGRMGAEIGVSQSLGRGDEEGAKQYAQNAVLLAMGLGASYGLLLLVLRGPLVGFFAFSAEDAHVARDAELYLAIVSLGMPFGFVASSLVGAFNGSGNSKTPFLTNAAGLVANMILDPLMIFGLNLGVAGAALATVLAQAFSFALLAVAMKRGRGRPFARFSFFTRLQGAIVRQILKWSVPIGLESMFFTLLTMVSSRLVTSFGASAMAVSRVGSQIESLSWLIGGGFGSALTAFMGQNFGAGKWTRIHKGFRIAAGAMLVWGVCITAMIFFGAEFLFSIFLRDPIIVAMGVTYLQILAACQLPQCFESIAGSTFKGTGRTLPPSVVSITANALRVVLAYALAKTPLGLNGVWIAISLGAAMRGVALTIWYLIDARRQPRQDRAALQPEANIRQP